MWLANQDLLCSVLCLTVVLRSHANRDDCYVVTLTVYCHLESVQAKNYAGGAGVDSEHGDRASSVQALA
jgi:hypothetical protein